MWINHIHIKTNKQTKIKKEMVSQWPSSGAGGGVTCVPVWGKYFSGPKLKHGPCTKISMWRRMYKVSELLPCHVFRFNGAIIIYLDQLLSTQMGIGCQRILWQRMIQKTF